MREPEGRATFFSPKLAPMELISTKCIAIMRLLASQPGAGPKSPNSRHDFPLELLALIRIECAATAQVGNLPRG
jgi:hypothetical protein